MVAIKDLEPFAMVGKYTDPSVGDCAQMGLEIHKGLQKRGYQRQSLEGG